MKSVAILSVVAVGAFAQQTIIPSGISTGCTTFLNTLNSDSGIKTCTDKLVAAVGSYAPGASGSTTLTTALSAACAPGVDAVCSPSTIRAKLTSFAQQCSAELTGANKNADVISLYDLLYALVPFRKAVCATDNSQSYCLQKVKSSSSSAPSSVGSFATSGMPFLGLSKDLAYGDLCTQCTKSVFTAYFSWQSEMPYAVGLGNSKLLSGETDLVDGIQSTCGNSFLSDNVAAVGGSLGGGVGTDSGAAAVGVKVGSVFGAVAVALLASL